MYLLQFKRSDTFYYVYSKSKKRIRSYILSLVRDNVTFNYSVTYDEDVIRSLYPRHSLFYVSRCLDD